MFVVAKALSFSIVLPENKARFNTETSELNEST